MQFNCHQSQCVLNNKKKANKYVITIRKTPPFTQLAQVRYRCLKCLHIQLPSPLRHPTSSYSTSISFSSPNILIFNFHLLFFTQRKQLQRYHFIMVLERHKHKFTFSYAHLTQQYQTLGQHSSCKTLSKIFKPYCTIKGARIAPCISNWLDGLKMGFDSQQRHKIFLLFTSCRPALRTTHGPLQRVVWASYP